MDEEEGEQEGEEGRVASDIRDASVSRDFSGDW